MAAASATCAYASSFRSPGTKGYTHGTLEGNWFEERTRAEAGEFVQVPMMLTPDVRTMIIGSKRGLADDGFCEYETVTRSMFKPMDEKIVHPVCREPGEWYSPFLGSGIQHDGRSKTRSSAENRSRNMQLEPRMREDCEAATAIKMISPASVTSMKFSSSIPQATGSFGSILPRNGQVPPQFETTNRLAYIDPRLRTTVR